MGHLIMSDKERLRKALLEMVKQGKITLVMAASQSGMSYRNAKRLYGRYRREGDAGLTHKARGQGSNHGHPDRKKIIACYKEKYEGFGPTLASEKLAEDDKFVVDHDTLRAWLLEENLWCRQRKRSPHRQQRERRAQFGELVQMDGSIHDWLEEGRHRCLLNMVDDATGKTFSHLESGETTRCVFLTVWKWIERYGIPLAVYVDFKNVYVTQKNICHFERACGKLGIRIIKAHSPQAKGRVERNHAVYQDRFVKELRLRNVKTVEEANSVLANGFVDKLNIKFEKQARNSESAHRPLNGMDLNQIFCWEYERQIQNDFTFSFQNKCYQVKKPYGCTVRPKVEVCVRKHLDDTVTAWYKGEKLQIKILDKRPRLIEINSPEKNVISLVERGRLGREKSSWGKSNTKIFSMPRYAEAYYTSKACKVSRRLKSG